MGDVSATDSAIAARRTRLCRVYADVRQARRRVGDEVGPNRCDSAASARDSFIEALGQSALFARGLVAMNDAFAGGDVQCADRCSERSDRCFVRRGLVDRVTCGRDARTYERSHGSISRRSATLNAH